MWSFLIPVDVFSVGGECEHGHATSNPLTKLNPSQFWMADRGRGGKTRGRGGGKRRPRGNRSGKRVTQRGTSGVLLECE